MQAKATALLLIVGLAASAAWGEEARIPDDKATTAGAHAELKALLDPRMTAGSMRSDSAAAGATRQSIKCDLRMVDGISIRRLADCDSATLISLLAHPEAKLVQFQINPDDMPISNGTRAELRDLYESVNGEETWYRFSAALPTSFPVSPPENVVLAQWHEHAKPGGHSLRPPLAHRLVNGDFVVSLWNSQLYDARMGNGDGDFIYRDPRFQLGSFVEYVYRIDWFPDPRGRVTGWKRHGCVIMPTCGTAAWQKFVDYAGAVGYSDVEGYYFKFGLYTVHPFDKPFVAYDFGYMRGASADAVGVDRQALGEL